MSTSDFINNFNNIVSQHGSDVVIYSYSKTYSGSEYDDSYSTTSGTGVSGTGMIQSVTSNTGGTDLKLLEQGAIEINDKKLIIKSSYAVDELSRIDINSSGNTFSVVQIIPYEVAGTVVYNNVYVRKRVGL